MVEAGDINDTQILNATTQRKDVRGLTQFLFKLPSGVEINSEWIPDDHLKQALRLWVDAVRSRIVEDAAALRRAKAKPSTPATTGTEQSSANTTRSSDTVAVASESIAASDPLEMARTTLASLDAKIVLLHNHINAQQAVLASAEIERKRWAKVVSALLED